MFLCSLLLHELVSHPAWLAPFVCMELDTTIYNLSSVLQMCRFSRAVFNAPYTHTHISIRSSPDGGKVHSIWVYALSPDPPVASGQPALLLCSSCSLALASFNCPSRWRSGVTRYLCVLREIRERERGNIALCIILYACNIGGLCCAGSTTWIWLSRTMGSIDSSVPVHELYNVHYTQHLTCINFRCADLSVD